MERFYAGALIAAGGSAIMMCSGCSGPADTPVRSAFHPQIIDSREMYSPRSGPASLPARSVLRVPTESPHAWIPIAGADRAAPVRRAIDKAAPGWRAAGLDETDVNRAGDLSGAFLLSVLWADFVPYKQAMRDLGLTFNSDSAEELLKLYEVWKLYPELDELRQSGRGTLERFAHAWENPSPRSTTISRLDVAAFRPVPGS